MKMPVVAIVGRPNVGKSSLLNAMAGRLISIVQDMPGVTRDRISHPLAVPLVHGKMEVRYVELLDTGGYGFHDETGLTDHIKHQIELALARADLVLFLVDCQAGLTSVDEEMAHLLRGKDLKVVLIANKADGTKADLNLGEFARLGFGTPVGVSAINNRNLDRVFDAIRKGVDIKNAPAAIPEPEMMVAIVGKRNAGKSTLVNSIARTFEGDESIGDRVIVSEVPGTTRDSVDVRFEREGQTLTVIDTAGVRKKRHMVTNDIEFYSFHRAERSIRRADVVLLLIDATEPVSEPDKKLAAYIAEQFKPVVLVVNKWDLAKGILHEQSREQGQDPDDRHVMEQYREYLDKTLRHVDYSPIAFITAKEGRNVQQVMDLARHLHKQASERVGTGRLNTAVETIFQERTPTHKSGKRPRVYYATQTDVNPPEIVLFVNNASLIDEGYQRFMINRFRELLPYAEVPIKLVIRGKSPGAVPANRDAPSRPVWDGNAATGRPVHRAPGQRPGGGKSAGKRGGPGKGHLSDASTEAGVVKPNGRAAAGNPPKAPRPGKSLKRTPGGQRRKGR